MSHFAKMLDAQLILIVYMLMGMYCCKKEIIDENTKKKIIDLI